LNYSWALPFDPDRGSGFVPRKREPEPYERFMSAFVVAFPRPDLTEGSPCMLTGMPWLRRLARQVAPRRLGDGCCWYHAGDWHRVSRMALRIFRQVQQREPIPSEAQTDAVQQASTAGKDDWTNDALESLLTDPIHLDRDIGYINGRHRAKSHAGCGSAPHTDHPSCTARSSLDVYETFLRACSGSFASHYRS
jgi:hypothetical protein